MAHHVRLALFVVLAAVAPVAAASSITGYEIVADPAIETAIAPLKALFVANVGKPFTRDVQLADVKRLQGLGTVAMVRTGTKAYKEGTKLCYRVEANPVIKSIELAGLTVVPPDDVLAEFATQPGQVLDYAKLFADLNKIPELVLAKKGVMYTDVTDVKDVTVADGHVTVKVREFAMGDLHVNGVTGAEADLVRRTFHVRKGSAVVRSQLLTSLCDVYQLSMVQDVDWAPKFDHATGRVDIWLAVTRQGAHAAAKEKGRLPQTTGKADPKSFLEL